MTMYKGHSDQTSIMGDVPKLAKDAVNPMWAIEAGLEPFLEAHPELYAPPAKKKKEAKPHSWDFPTTKKPVDIDTEVDVLS